MGITTLESCLSNVEYRVGLNAIIAYDTDSLMHFSEEELINKANELEEARRIVTDECGRLVNKYNRSTFRRTLGEIEYALLLIAGALKKKGHENNDIVKRYDRYLDIIFAYESLKIIDNMTIEDIVEEIERRSGGVYYILKKFIENQYLTDREDASKLGLVSITLLERYKDRRENVKKALQLYIERHPAVVLLRDIDEAVEAALQARNTRLETIGSIESIEQKVTIIEQQVSNGNYQDALELMEKTRRQLLELKNRIETEKQALRTTMTRLHNNKASNILSDEEELINSLLGKLESLEKKYTLIQEKIKAGTTPPDEKGHTVTPGEARALEISLVERALSKNEDGARIYDPRKDEWRHIKWGRTLRYEINTGREPSGAGLRLISYKGLIMKKPDITLDITTLIHPRNYKVKGYDDMPVDLPEIIDAIERKLEDLWAENQYLIQVIASPTGFTGKALSILDSSKSKLPLLTGRLTLYLVDLATGEIFYNQNDKASINNLAMARPWLMEEETLKAIQYLKSDKAKIQAYRIGGSTPYLKVGDIVKETGLAEEAVKKAMYRLAREGYGRIEVTDGITAFIYEG